MSRPTYFFDIGNTRLKLWRCTGLRQESHWAGFHEGRPETLLSALPAAFDEAPTAVCGVSVLGKEAELRFSDTAMARWGVRPEFALTQPRFGSLANGYKDEPEKLGVDRWLGIIGAAGECDVLCVVGCGTAITIDILAGDAHRGGYILPGLRMMQEALLTGTQRVRFEQDSPYSLVPGTSTSVAVRNGAILAVVAAIERVARDEAVSRVVLTGGDAETVARFLQLPLRVDSGLLLRGMMRYFAHRNEAPTQGASNEVGG